MLNKGLIFCHVILLAVLLDDISIHVISLTVKETYWNDSAKL